VHTACGPSPCSSNCTIVGTYCPTSASQIALNDPGNWAHTSWSTNAITISITFVSARIPSIYATTSRQKSHVLSPNPSSAQTLW
jgi:hypothetical protein